jgi:hypothetical protein
MCEQIIIDGGQIGPLRFTGTHKSVQEHHRLTVLNLVQLRELAPDLPIILVLQGPEPDDYRRHPDLYSTLARIDVTPNPSVERAASADFKTPRRRPASSPRSGGTVYCGSAGSGQKRWGWPSTGTCSPPRTASRGRSTPANSNAHTGLPADVSEELRKPPPLRHHLAHQRRQHHARRTAHRADPTLGRRQRLSPPCVAR